MKTKLKNRWLKNRTELIFRSIVLAVIVGIPVLFATIMVFVVEPRHELAFRAEKERMSLVVRPLKELGFEIIEMHRSGHRVPSTTKEGDVFYDLTVRTPAGLCDVPPSAMLPKIADAYEKNPSGRLLLISYYPISLKPDWDCRAHVSVLVKK